MLTLSNKSSFVISCRELPFLFSIYRPLMERKKLYCMGMGIWLPNATGNPFSQKIHVDVMIIKTLILHIYFSWWIGMHLDSFCPTKSQIIQNDSVFTWKRVYWITVHVFVKWVIFMFFLIFFVFCFNLKPHNVTCQKFVERYVQRPWRSPYGKLWIGRFLEDIVCKLLYE